MESVPLQPREHAVDSEISLRAKKWGVCFINSEIYPRPDPISGREVRKLEDDYSNFGLRTKNLQNMKAEVENYQKICKAQWSD